MLVMLRTQSLPSPFTFGIRLSFLFLTLLLALHQTWSEELHRELLQDGGSSVRWVEDRSGQRDEDREGYGMKRNEKKRNEKEYAPSDEPSEFNSHKDFLEERSRADSSRAKIPHLTVDVIPRKDYSRSNVVSHPHWDSSSRSYVAGSGRPNSHPHGENDRSSINYPNYITARYVASPPYTAKFVRGKNVMNSPLNPRRNSLSSSYQDPEDLNPHHLDHHNESHRTQRKKNLHNERRRKRLKNNLQAESRVQSSRQRYWYRRKDNYRSPSSDPRPSINPFDRISYNQTSRGRTFDSRVVDGDLESSNHFTYGSPSNHSRNHFTYGSPSNHSRNHFTYGFPSNHSRRYNKALHDINRPITPYNWRRNRNRSHRVNGGSPWFTSSSHSQLGKTVPENATAIEKNATSSDGVVRPTNGRLAPFRNPRSFFDQPSSNESDPSRRKRPNILLVLTDDLDVELGEKTFSLDHRFLCRL